MPTDLKALAYSLLGMPDETDREAVEIGEFCPADVPFLVQEISRHRIAQLKHASTLPDLSPLNKSKVWALMFHTYDDFILQTQHDQPSKKDDLPAGHSLNRFQPNLAGYLAYLKKAAPDLARFFFLRMRARIPERDREKHTYVLGKSGSGKTEFLKLLIYGYLRQRHNITTIIIDPHGDFAEEVARWKENTKDDGKNLIYIDPFLDQSSKQVPVLNPLTLIDHSDDHAIDISAQALLGAFKEILRNASLTNQMEALLVPCLSVLFKRPDSTLADLGSGLIEYSNPKNDDGC